MQSWRKINNLIILEERKYNPKTKTMKVELQIIDIKQKKTFSIFHLNRLYNFIELKTMFNKAGLEVIKRYGGLRLKRFSKDATRVVVLAEKRR